MLGRIFVARQAFSTVIDGRIYAISPGDTVREGHPLLEGGRDIYFTPQKVKYEHKPPAKKPGFKPGK